MKRKPSKPRKTSAQTRFHRHLLSAIRGLTDEVSQLRKYVLEMRQLYSFADYLKPTEPPMGLGPDVVMMHKGKTTYANFVGPAHNPFPDIRAYTDGHGNDISHLVEPNS